MDRRVAITGVGALSGFGVGVRAFWEGLCSGASTIKGVTLFDAGGFPWQLGAEVAGFAGAKDYVPKGYRKAVKVMARDIELAVAAAKLAVEDAGLATRGTLPEGSEGPTTYPAGRLGCQIGAGLISAEPDELTAALSTAARPDRSGIDLNAWGTEDGGAGAMQNLPPLWLLKYLPNMLACHVTIIHGAEGPSNTITAVEASGLLSLGESARVIERGDADACFSGGAESPLNIFRLVRFGMVHRVAESSAGDDGAAIVRPFDPRSRGGVFGEGGGILILEELGSARARGAKVYAELRGVGAGQSASSAPGGGWLTGGLDADVDEGLQAAIENALEDAGVPAAEIDAIVPHGSGVWAMDRGEAGALRAVFGPRLAQIETITLTPAVGECLAGLGGLAVAAAAMAIREQRLPARIHRGTPIAGLRVGPVEARAARVRNVLVCTGALGGQNAAVVVSAVD